MIEPGPGPLPLKTGLGGKGQTTATGRDEGGIPGFLRNSHVGMRKDGNGKAGEELEYGSIEESGASLLRCLCARSLGIHWHIWWHLLIVAILICFWGMGRQMIRHTPRRQNRRVFHASNPCGPSGQVILTVLVLYCTLLTPPSGPRPPSVNHRHRHLHHHHHRHGHPASALSLPLPFIILGFFGAARRTSELHPMCIS